MNKKLYKTKEKLVHVLVTPVTFPCPWLLGQIKTMCSFEIGVAFSCVQYDDEDKEKDTSV